MQYSTEPTPVQTRPWERPFGKFSKMFSGLAPWTITDEELKIYLNTYVGFPPEISRSIIPAGYTYLGQFISHDLSLDLSPFDGETTDPHHIDNFRTPALNLETLYGMGPRHCQYLFDIDRASFVFEEVKTNDNFPRFYDLPRLNGQAVIPDNRNDENAVIAQLHVAFQKLHNKFVIDLMGDDVFAQARKKVIWHYQWIVLFDFVPKVTGKTILEVKQLIERIKEKGRLDKAMPAEFSAAVFRFGHSQVRSVYKFNPYQPSMALFPDPRENTKIYVDWSLFFDTPPTKAGFNTANLIDMFFSSAFMPMGKRPSVLLIDIMRGRKFGLASGQTIASQIKCQEMTMDNWDTIWNTLGKVSEFEGTKDPLLFSDQAPLCYYILAEALIMGEGERLGPVGSHIITETIISLILADEESFLFLQSDWIPSDMGGHEKIDFNMTDLLKLAGVYHGALVPVS